MPRGSRICRKLFRNGYRLISIVGYNTFFERLRQSWLKSLCPDIRVDSFFDFYVSKIVNHH
jgi:hypothetical protein